MIQKIGLIGSEREPRGRWQQERSEANDLMSKTKAKHVRFKTLYIS